MAVLEGKARSANLWFNISIFFYYFEVGYFFLILIIVQTKSSYFNSTLIKLISSQTT